MKIGFEAKRAFYNNRGLGNYSRTLLKNLFRFFPEHTYQLYTPGSGNRPSFFSSAQNISVQTPLGLHALVPALWRSFFSSLQMGQEKLDVFHGLSHEVPYQIKKKNPQTKVIVTIHDLLYLRLPQFYPWIDRKVYDLKFRHSCAESDLVIATSQQTKKDLIEYLKIPAGKIQVLYQAADDSFYRDYSPEQISESKKKYQLPQHFVLSVGALVENKNFSLLLQALQLIAVDQRPHLLLVGRGEAYKNKLLKLAQDLGLSSSLTIVDFVHAEDLPLLYAGADALLYPSFFEGFGIPLLEAGLQGTPILTSQLSCYPEVAGEEAQYVDSLTAEAWAPAILRVLEKNHPDERAKLKKDFARRFSPQELSRELIDLYQRVP